MFKREFRARKETVAVPNLKSWGILAFLFVFAAFIVQDGISQVIWQIKPENPLPGKIQVSLQNLAVDSPFSKLRVERNGALFLNLVALPPGTFTMGSDKWNPHSEGPLHQVSLTQPTLCSETEVTQRQFLEIVGENPSEYSDHTERPVHNVSWYDAILFCNGLSEALGRTKFYSVTPKSELRRNFLADGFRLPTEAEWEYACRSGTTLDQFWGEAANPNIFFLGEGSTESDAKEATNGLTTLKGKASFAPGRLTLGSDYCWDRESLEQNPPAKTADSSLHILGVGPQPVATRKPNPWGLFDMLGNVSEWCDDWVHPFNRSMEYPGRTPRIDPLLTTPFRPRWDAEASQFRPPLSSGSGKSFEGESSDGINPEPGAIIRGGAWSDFRFDCRSTARHDVLLGGGGAAPEIGFRVVLNLPSTKEEN